MSETIPDRIAAARRGENPMVVRKMRSGWAVMFNWQKLPGYLILLADPPVASLNDLTADARQQFLADMATLGDAVLKATGATRINYQILCNLDPFLHAHICPRYAWEEEKFRTAAPAAYDQSAGPFFDPHRHRKLMQQIKTAIDKLLTD